MSQIDIRENSAKTDNITKGEHFLSAFMRAKNDLSIYPSTNPVVGESLKAALCSLEENFAPAMIEIGVEKNRLLFCGEAIGLNDPRFGKLALALYRRSIRKIALAPEIAFDEMKQFLDILNMKEEDIARAGGVSALATSKAIGHVTIEEVGELVVLDGDEFADLRQALPENGDSEQGEGDFHAPDSPEGLSRMFVPGVGRGGRNTMNLRRLLGNPAVFTELLEKCADQIGSREDDSGPSSPDERARRLLDMVHTLSCAMGSLPSEHERSLMMKKIAESVLGLSENLRAEIINRGMVPRLKRKGMESDILSKFPLTPLSDALIMNFNMSGGTASVLGGNLENLDLAPDKREKLVEKLRLNIKAEGNLAPEIEAALASGKFTIAAGTAEGPEAAAHTPDPKRSAGSAAQSFGVPDIEGYPPEKILFLDSEKGELLEGISEEFESDAAGTTSLALINLLHHENSQEGFTELIGRVVEIMDKFLADRDYDSASGFIGGLQAQCESKARELPGINFEALEGVIEKYTGEEFVSGLVADFKEMNRESDDFKKAAAYIEALGQPAISALLRQLEDEPSRHVRLLICQALARVGDAGVKIVARRVEHAQWHVARNAASILGQIGTPACVPHLKKALTHTELRVRREAVKGLASIRTEEALELVCGCIEDIDVEMRRAALGWVVATRISEAMPAVEKILDEKAVWGKDDKVVRLAIEALGAIRTSPAKVLLDKLTETRRLIFHRKKAAMIREAAKGALLKARKRNA